ncbi:hypothetical protein [Paenibacillus sp. HB172176]|uniref:hypothetical protein n=1 Tax=Paenibacillus sp. HB172176 TaxID=2493690 RepID=UPI00143BA3DD|nr:hypothetical protein [Paenibacillus sp. HB172176]
MNKRVKKNSGGAVPIKTSRKKTKSGVYIGPSLEGTDKEYVKIISGKVSDRKPSFA